MISKNIKKISSILEIIILYSIFIYIFLKTFKNYSILNIKHSFINLEEKDPTLISILNSSNNTSHKTIFNNYISILVKKLFSKVLNSFNFIFSIFHKIFGSFLNTLDTIRNLTKPIRLFFKNTTLMFYKKLQNFMIGISYSMHKIRNSLRRSVSGYNMAFHSLNHINYSFESILNSPIPKIVKSFSGVTHWLDKSFNKLGLCFDGKTLINTINGIKKIQDIQPGEELDKDNFVISSHKFICNCDMYKYNNIIVSGSHLVKHNNKWSRIKSLSNSIKINYMDYCIFCLSTSNGQIIINNIVFKDYSESYGLNINNTINSIILTKLNNTINIVNNNGLNYIEQGLDKNTYIKKYNNYVRIKNISIGDYLDYDNRVIGIVKICSKFNTVFEYKNKWIFSNNIKINENGIWINIIDSIYSRKISNYIDTLYHLVVTKEKIILENNLIIADYVGVHNNITNNIIDKTVENYLNLKI